MPMTTATGGVQVQQQQQSAAAQIQQYAPPVKKPRRRVLTSLTLEIFVFFGAWWDVFYYIVNILVFVWKGDMEAPDVHFSVPMRDFALLNTCNYIVSARNQPSLPKAQLCHGVQLRMAMDSY